MTTSLVENHWDYSLHAKYYEKRPNYSPRAIDALLAYVHAAPDRTQIADIGAGTGNLSILLLDRNYSVTAVEPNDNMHAIGIERTTRYPKARWVKANGTETTLSSETYDWVTFGSSFNVLDRQKALIETHRILKPQGFFSCMWNHRNLNDPTQEQAESIIMRHVPQYERGVRREDQRPVLEACPLFKDIFYLEVDFDVTQSLEDYLDAWRSVKNKYWDLSTPEGTKLFETIMDDMRAGLPPQLTIRYTTRAWTCQKTDG